jgi:hypothetical protein
VSNILKETLDMKKMFGSNEVCQIDTELNTQTNNCMTILMKEPKKEINILGSVIWGPLKY